MEIPGAEVVSASDQHVILSGVMTKRKRPFPSDRPGFKPAGDTRGPGRNSSQNRDLADPDMGVAPRPAKGSAGQGPAYWL